jgi:hypothetical protein
MAWLCGFYDASASPAQQRIYLLVWIKVRVFQRIGLEEMSNISVAEEPGKINWNFSP